MINYDSKIIPDDSIWDEVIDVLGESRKVVIQARGNSMLPFIVSRKDSVMLESPENINVGDVVLVCCIRGNTKRYILHRIIEMDGEKITTMGDGNCIPDKSCNISNVIAKAVSIIKPSGKTIKIPKARLWQLLLPVRRYILRIYRILYPNNVEVFR